VDGPRDRRRNFMFPSRSSHIFSNSPLLPIFHTSPSNTARFLAVERCSNGSHLMFTRLGNHFPHFPVSSVRGSIRHVVSPIHDARDSMQKKGATVAAIFVVAGVSE
jgi:hypothetical protein